MSAHRLIQYISDGYLDVDAQWRVRVANSRAEGLLRRFGPDLIGRSLWDVLPDVIGSSADRLIREVAAGTVPRRVEHFSPSRYIWIEALVVPGDDGIELFMQDVSERARRIESEAVQAAVRRVLMQAPVAISITRGPEHRYELVNARLQELVGVRELEGRLVRNAFPELHGSPLLDVLDEVYRTGTPYVGQNVPVRFDRDGSGTLQEGVFDFTYQPLLDQDGRVWGIMTVAVEVTEYVRDRERVAASTGTTAA